MLLISVRRIGACFSAMVAASSRARVDDTARGFRQRRAVCGWSLCHSSSEWYCDQKRIMWCSNPVARITMSDLESMMPVVGLLDPEVPVRRQAKRR